MLGKKSGLDSIRIKVEELGLDVPEERYPALLESVKRAGTKKRGLVTDDEFRRLDRASKAGFDVLSHDHPAQSTGRESGRFRDVRDHDSASAES